MRKKQPPVREQGFPPACAHLQGVRLVTLPPVLRPSARERSRCRLPALLSCRPHGGARVSFCPLQVWLRGREQQESPQQRGPLPVRAQEKKRPGPSPYHGPPSGRTTLPYPEERENHPNHRPRAAPPDRRPMTTGRIPQPDDPLRQPVQPHPWGVPQAVAPVPALWSDRLPPRMRAWLQQPSCGRARRMRLDAPRGKRLFALRQTGAAPHQAQRPPHQQHAGQRKIPLPVGPSVRQPRPREPARPRPQVQPSDCPHDDVWGSFLPPQVWLRGRERQEPPQRRAPLTVRIQEKQRPGPSPYHEPPSGRTTLPYPEEGKNHPSRRPRAAPPDRRPMTTGRIPQPDDPPRQPVPPHPWVVPQAVAPVPALWSDRLLLRMREWSQQPSCGRARRKWGHARHGRRLSAVRRSEADPLPARMLPPPQRTGQQKTSLPVVRPPVRQTRTREPAR